MNGKAGLTLGNWIKKYTNDINNLGNIPNKITCDYQLMFPNVRFSLDPLFHSICNKSLVGEN